MESTFIILTQIITFGTARSMFHCVLKRKKKDWFSLVGALGYLLLPYHVYVVTESVDRSQILIWMVVPILAASLVKMSDTEKMFWKTGYGLTALLALGIIGRLDGVAALTLLRGWYMPETMAISGDRNSGSCHGIPHLYDVETLAIRRVLCGERIGIYQHHGAGIQYRRSVQYLFL